MSDATTDYVADPAAGAMGGGKPIPAAQTGTAPKLQQSHEGEYHSDFGDKEVEITRSVKLYAFCASLNSCNFGYDVGSSTAAALMIQEQWNLSDEQREIFIGTLNLFSIVGALCSSHISDRYGRRLTFLMSSQGFLLGLLLQTLSTNYTMLLIGRALVGIGCGVGLAIDPLYISEMSPAKHRGELVTWSELGINAGILLGFCMSTFLVNMPDELEWRAIFALGMIMPCVMIYFSLKVMPETPRWYCLKFRYDEAKSILSTIYPPGFNVDLVVDDIKESLERERIAEETLGWSTIIHPTPAFRRMLFVGIFMAASQQMVGIDAIQYYLLDVMSATTDSRTTQNLLLILLGVIKLSCVYVAGKYFDYRGRRPLVFLSLIGLTLSLLLLSLTFYVAGEENTNTAFTVVGLASYLAFFSIGVGPAAWLIPSEVFATCIRAKAMSLATLGNRIVATVWSSSVLTMQKNIQWEGVFMLLAAICVLVISVLYVYLPETKGHSLEDMSLFFAEVTKDTSILEAEKKLRMGEEMSKVGRAEGSAAEGGTLA